MGVVRPYLPGKVKRSGRDNIITLCPFHDDNSPSFWLNVNNGLWICFSCGLRGSLQTFLKMAGLSRSTIDEMMEPLRGQLEAFHRLEKVKRDTKFRTDPYRGDTILPEALLGVYDYKPNMMINAGFKPEILRAYDIGYDRRLDRVTFPIRDLYGNLVGISGRATLPGDKPRYKVYRGGHRNKEGNYVTGDFGENFDEEYRDFESTPHRFLWNSHNVYPAVLVDTQGHDPIIIVEGEKKSLWLTQYGFPRNVAATGSSLSDDQKNLIFRMSGNPIMLFLDNDEPGRKATVRAGKALRQSVIQLLVAKYPEGTDGQAPDDLDQAQLKWAIDNAEEWGKWVRTTNS